MIREAVTAKKKKKNLTFLQVGEPLDLFPNEARLRNLTYDAPLYVDIVKTTYVNPGKQND